MSGGPSWIFGGWSRAVARGNRGTATATGTPVVGGLSTGLALDILRALGNLDLVGMDVVEVAPAYDVGEITALAAATLALEFICLHAAKARAR